MERSAGGDAEIVDDHTSLPEEWEQGLGDQKCAMEIGVDHLAPGGEVERWRWVAWDRRCRHC